MTSWADIEATEPELMARARECLTSVRNAVLGTLRRDGSPRLSGIDPVLLDGELWLGSMGGARKGADLRRDPRLAIHSVPWESRRVSDDQPTPGADAKITGRAELITDADTIHRLGHHHTETADFEPPSDSDLFRVDIDSVVIISVEGDELVVDRWSSDEGRRVVRRA